MNDQTKTKTTLLIVEDDTDLRESLNTLLEPYCDKIFLANNGKEGLKIIQETADLCAVLSDIKMPVMQGLELLTHIRHAFNPIPFVVLTGHGDQAGYREAIRLNATDFLPKPFDNDHLIEVMKRALAYGSELIRIENELEELFKSSDIAPEKIEIMKRAKRTVLAMRVESSLYIKKVS